METKVSYGFSEALNLVDDFKNCLTELNADPTGSQIIIMTDIESYDGEPTPDNKHDVYFMVRKSEWDDKTGDAIETRMYHVYTDFGGGLDEDTRNDLEQYYGDCINADSLRSYIRDIIDNHQITDIYMDSL